MSKRMTFDEWLDQYLDWEQYVGVNGLNHKAFACEAWNHQLQHIDKLELKLKLAMECIDLWISQGSINHMGKYVSGKEIGEQYKQKIKEIDNE